MLGLNILAESPIKNVVFDNDKLYVSLTDGRVIPTPLEWYPRLANATDAERHHWEAGITGIHWPDVDEDLSIEGMLAGRPSIEYIRLQRTTVPSAPTNQQHPNL